MERDVLAEADQRRVFRATFEVAASFGLDLDGTIDLARSLTRAAFDGAAARTAGLAATVPAAAAED
jgi:hypothetical protein